MKAFKVPVPVAHLMALFTAVVWGTTYLATQELLGPFTPLQIMLMRFAIAYVMLFILCPKTLLLKWREELFCLLLGIIGCTLYFLSEANALKFTQSANVSIFFAASPIVTSILVFLFVPKDRPKKSIFLGFGVALIGVAMVVFNGTVLMKLNPLGDLLAFGSCLCWGTYSFLLRLRATRYNGLQLTRRIMLWGFLTSLPVALIQGAAGGATFSLAPLFGDYHLLLCLLFLGLVGSGLCFSLWSTASAVLGSPVVTCYLYICPFATLIAAWLIKDEKITWMGLAGTVLILCGVFVSERLGRQAHPTDTGVLTCAPAQPVQNEHPDATAEISVAKEMTTTQSDAAQTTVR